jgi:hypothetical protein
MPDPGGRAPREERAAFATASKKASSPKAGEMPRRRRALPIPEVSAGMFVRRVQVLPAEVVYVKGILEASEGLGMVFAERGGDLVVAAPHERAQALLQLLEDLAHEIGARVDPDPQGTDARPAASAAEEPRDERAA